MKTITNGEPHDFQKKNLVTQKDRKGCYDEFQCARCGLTGKSRRLGVIEVVESANDKKVNFCLGNAEAISKVKITSEYAIKQFGFEKDKEYLTCECPPQYAGKFPNSIWVFSEERREAIRMLTGEYKILK